MNVLFSFSEKKDYKFTEVIIDEKFGYSILLNGKKVGGILLTHQKIKKPSLNLVAINGIEIDLPFRRQGIASAIINKLKNEYDGIYGAITEQNSVDFWKKMGAVLYKSIPIPERLKHTVGIDEPLCFYIADKIEAIKFLENVKTQIEEISELAIKLNIKFQ